MVRTHTLRQGTSPLILSIPHAGRDLIPGLEQRLTSAGRSLIDTDWWLERLYDLPLWDDLDPTIITAKLSRFVIDLNRDPDGASLYPGQATTELVPTTTFDGEPIYRDGQGPSAEDIAERRDLYFWPYHRALAGEIERVKAAHGIALLYDCHSIRSVIPRLFEGRLPDLNLGTNSGSSCHPGLQSRLSTILENSPYSSAVNGRFKGGWITRHYGRPHENVHAVQMEIACATYMSETPPFAYDTVKAGALQVVLSELLTTIARFATLAPRIGT